ncbi:sulfite exporter TauE/SafE family protein [Actinoplanes awajinensis]|uniref:Probable membrane transporter protein n=1 Tax=Actinoplanes awajinensis subsp. mycoplanecinus TaxID=135947 RepID=A0A101JN91_9ACTN|nr:sulfite exporter TauE/SafE family protein [Actinoplanes awajinensis]KUL29882.1 permease [Actinoplanes awajinensis subsp. mycoplanecinus]
MDWTMALAGLGVGIIVGLTGMGGGALMTPILVLLFHVNPVAAISSDLAASAVMKPFGGAVHARRGTVNWRLVGWLCAGSVPSAFLGVLLLRLLGDDESVQHTLKVALGAALLLAAAGMLLKAWTARRTGDGPPAEIVVRPVPTLLIGIAGGLVVGLTSVGSGSLIIVALLALYPRLRANDLVGTDLVQAVPLVTAAALGHAFFGDLHLDIAGAVVLGSIPGVLIGSRISSRAPGGLVRSALIIVLLASSLKLFDLPTQVVGAVAGGAALIAIGLGLSRRYRKPAPAPAPDRETISA